MNGPTEVRDEQHLGDGVYVCHDGDYLWIRANDARWSHMTPSVALELQVMINMIRYASEIWPGILIKESK